MMKKNPTFGINNFNMSFYMTRELIEKKENGFDFYSDSRVAGPAGRKEF